jgi:DnaK suppressor protein
MVAARKSTKKKVAAKKKAGKKVARKAAGKPARRTAAKPGKKKTVKTTTTTAQATDSLVHGIAPYREKKGEEYMGDAQIEHFRAILQAWREQLVDEINRTIHTMQDETINHPDPNDRATQETDMSIELRPRCVSTVRPWTRSGKNRWSDIALSVVTRQGGFAPLLRFMIPSLRPGVRSHWRAPA